MKTRKRRYRLPLAVMMSDLMPASWETITRRSRLIVQNDCLPALDIVHYGSESENWQFSASIPDGMRAGALPCRQLPADPVVPEIRHKAMTSIARPPEGSADERFGGDGGTFLLLLCNNTDERRPVTAASPASFGKAAGKRFAVGCPSHPMGRPSPP
jgi:hypothetical protein